MSTTYNVIKGDTFETISRKKYGSETYTSLIANANPGVVEPLTTGTTIVVPTQPDAPRDIPQQAAASTSAEVAITIGGARFRFWSTVRVTRSLDTVDTVELEAPFDADAPGFREAFRPFAFKTVAITVGGVPLFTGTMVAVSPIVEGARIAVSASSYSLPGVLNDCTPPASTYPLEFDNQGLEAVATNLSAPFGIAVEFQADAGPVFERVAIKPGDKILAFLSELAKQRGLVIGSTPGGKLLFTKSIESGAPVAVLKQGASPVLSVTPFFSPQEYYSHITGIEPVIVGLAGAQFTVKNPRLLGVVRPMTFSVTDTQEAGIKSAVEAKAGRMFGNMAAYSVSVATWFDPSGTLWAPNTVIKLLAPGAMVYTEYMFILRSVSFERGSSSERATLDLVVPGSFSGEIPEVLPWDD